MKNKLLAALTLLTLVVMISSCAGSRKYGCPMAQVNEKSSNT